jgi:uncharacterized protein (TIGR02246 family)
MKKKVVLLTCLFACILLISCDSTPEKTEAGPMVKSETSATNMSAIKAEIQAIENQWAEALNRKDMNALLSLYADDAISMQDGGPALKGKAAIQAQQEKDFAAPARYASISFQTQDVFGTADEVTEVGTSSEKDAAGKITGTGKYMAVFRKQEGKYKCVREIYNRDAK